MKFIGYFFCLTLFLSLVPVAFAENVEVVGRVDNPNTTTTGSNVVFKNSASQQVVSTTKVDPAGVYSISVPQGKYDVTIIPPSGSGLSEITTHNQEFQSNATANFSLPSRPISQTIHNNFGMVVLIALVILVLLIGIGAGSFFLRKKR